MGDGRRVLCDVEMEVVVTAVRFLTRFHCLNLVMVLGLLVAAVHEQEQARALSPAGRHSVRVGDSSCPNIVPMVPLSRRKLDARERMDIHSMGSAVVLCPKLYWVST